MPLPIIPSTNPTTIPAQSAIATADSFGYLLHFYIAPPWDGAWGLQLKSANWDAVSGTFAPLDTDKTTEADRAQHAANFPDVRPLLAPTLPDGTTPNPQFLPGLAQIFGAVLEMFPTAILLQKTTNAVAAANSMFDIRASAIANANALLDSDPNKVTAVTAANALPDLKGQAVATAQTALDVVRKQLGAT